MADVKWIKIATEIFDNRKIKQLENLPDGDSIIVIWFKLLCLAGNVNDNGYVYFTREIPYTDQMMAAQFNRPVATVQLALSMFEKFGMIQIVDDILKISNWERYQNVDKMNELKERNRLAQQRRRAKLKAAQAVNDMSHDMSLTCQPCQCTDIDIDKDIDNITTTTTTTISKPATPSDKMPPSFAEVHDYFKHQSCLDQKCSAARETARFITYNAARGWDCLPRWREAADLWVERIGDESRH